MAVPRADQHSMQPSSSCSAVSAEYLHGRSVIPACPRHACRFHSDHGSSHLHAAARAVSGEGGACSRVGRPLHECDNREFRACAELP